jgi:hypothetical protein
MNAVFGPGEAVNVHAREIAKRLSVAIPEATIDWEQGARSYSEKLQRLAALNCPKVLLDAYQSDTGHHVFLSVPIPQFPNATLSGIAESVDRDLGDSFDLSLHRYDISSLMLGAKMLADALRFSYHLKYDTSFEVCVEPGSCSDPMRTARLHLPIPCGDDPVIRLTALPNWQASAREAIVKWVQLVEHKDKLNSHTKAFASIDAYAAAAVQEIESIRSADRAWSIDWCDAPFQNGILLDQGTWTTIISLDGVPKCIVT